MRIHLVLCLLIVPNICCMEISTKNEKALSAAEHIELLNPFNPDNADKAPPIYAATQCKKIVLDRARVETPSSMEYPNSPFSLSSTSLSDSEEEQSDIKMTLKKECFFNALKSILNKENSNASKQQFLLKKSENKERTCYCSVQ